MGIEMDEWKGNVRADILVFPPVLRHASLFSFLDLYPIIGEALYLPVESEFGTRGNIKAVTLELLQTACQLIAVCFNVFSIVSMQQFSLGCLQRGPVELARQPAEPQRWAQVFIREY